MTEEWLERQEGPDGQFCELLKRIPYDRYRTIESAMAVAKSDIDRNDAAFRGLLWTASVKDALTGKDTNDIGRAGFEVVDPWRTRAVQLFNAWYTAAFPGPKDSSETDSPTPDTGTPESSDPTTPEPTPSATDEPT